MCLILVGWKTHRDYPLVVAANRDEFFSRPSAPAGFWPESPKILAGRDLEAGGTWLGVSEAGRVAMLTNVRSASPGPGRRSRGELATHWLQAAGATTLIHGHTHRPAEHDLGDGLRRVVLSDWDLSAPTPRAEVLRISAQGLQRRQLKSA